MNILFGMYLDGALWSRKPASAGEVRTGPQGLLRILETRLGLSGPEIHPARRINEYMRRVAAADCGNAWFHQSFTADPWSTARQLLEWRDELTEAGWKGKAEAAGPQRLSALAQLENMPFPLPPGRADRLRAVIARLGQDVPAGVASVGLMEPLELLPPAWRQVMGLLRAQGTAVGGWPEPPENNNAGNLGSIQAALRGSGTPSSLSRTDDSLVLLKAANEWEAAEHLSLWLASGRDANNEAAIICGAGTNILDQTLKNHGLPALGRAQPSRWREALQALPLLLANAWLPADIRPLVELLSLSEPLFPAWACRELLKAIAQEPGIGGRAWDRALDVIAEKQARYSAGDGETGAEEKARGLVDGIRSLLAGERFDPEKGIPEGNLRERCQKVIQRFGGRPDADPLLAEAAGQAREMQELCAGKGLIPRVTLERMLDTVIGAGSMVWDAREEAAPWQALDHPGALADPCGELVWWGFNDIPPAAGVYWGKTERDALAACGVVLEGPGVSSRREARAWQQALMRAQNRFIAVHIGQLAGEDSPLHPFWDTVLSAASHTGSPVSDEAVLACLVRECVDYGGRKEWSFAGRSAALEKAPVIKAEPVPPQYSVPASVIGRPRQLSFTQMSTLIGCPMKWALEYHAGLRVPDSQGIASGSKMIGNICHRVIEELYAGSRQWEAGAAAAEAGRLYDRLLPSMASELLLEGRSLERQRYKSAIMDAVHTLVQAVNRLGLRVERTEAPLSAALDGIPFEGSADLLLRDRDGQPCILDMKWTNYAKYKEKEVCEDGSLQLAAYAWLLRESGEAGRAHTGLYLLAQRKFLSDSLPLADELVVAPFTADETWERGTASFRLACGQLQSGLVEARGVMEEIASNGQGEASEIFKVRFRESGMLYQPPPCHFCDFAGLCGLAGGDL